MRAVRCLAVALGVCLLLPVGAQDLEELVSGAVSRDREMMRLEILRDNAELQIRKSDASRGLKIQLSSGSGLTFSHNLNSAITSSGLSVSPTVSVTAPDPANTSLSVGVPISVDLDAGGITPSLSTSISQPLNSLIGARKNRALRELQNRYTLDSADIALARRALGVKQHILSSLKALYQKQSQMVDIEYQIVDLQEEALRKRSLGSYEVDSYTYLQLEGRITALQESSERAMAEFDIALARLAEDTGVDIAALPAAIPEPVIVMDAADSVEPATVYLAELDLAVAEARVEQHSLGALPSLSIGAGFSFSETSAPLSVSVRASWLALDSGVRKLGRLELENGVKLKGLALDAARQSFSRTYQDLQLQVEALADRKTQLQRSALLAEMGLADTKILVEKGLQNETEIDKSQRTLEQLEDDTLVFALDCMALQVRIDTLLLSRP